jgi:hypothetical protein
MPDDFLEHIVPIAGGIPVDRIDEHSSGVDRERPRGRRIIGHVTSVRRESRPRDSEHTLDIRVGGEEYTEIVLRVPAGSYANLEGKRVVIYLEE